MTKQLLMTISLSSLLLASVFVVSVSAHGELHEEIGIINEEIANQKQRIEEINDRSEALRQQIRQKEKEEATLQGELGLLENRIAKTELDITAVAEEMKLVDIELQTLQQKIDHVQEELVTQRLLLKTMLQRLQVSDKDVVLELLFGGSSVNEVFDELAALESLSGDLNKALDQAKQSKEQLLSARGIQQGKRTKLADLERSLEQKKQLLDSEISSQEVLLAETQRSEDQFRALLQELRQEQLAVTFSVKRLQQDIQAKLDAQDELGDSTVLSWPAQPQKGISAYFHDPTYPFRHLFEHSGIDLPLRVGTPLKAVAPGYIAWTKKGRLYGNYVMVIHPGGLATLYAHLSGFNVSADQFVSRGDVIGFSGNTGLSTGPHLHFEVRKDGIPVNPLEYLINL